jgi:hypothetical protein
MDQPARADIGGGSANNPAWRLRTVDRLRSLTILEYMEIFHNRTRRHRSLGMLTPIQFEDTSIMG